MANGSENGAGFHWRTVDWIVRLLVPFIAVGVSILFTVVVANQSKLAAIEVRLEAMEARTQLLPPADYRTYMDTKFAEMFREIGEVREELRLHRLGVNGEY
jgi:hypothetical protein